MKLVSAYVAGFGRIKDYTHDFTDGLNGILEENGWGKTTFSVFIKSMFYGMEYSRRRELSEREHYLPWDANVYGGNLTFVVGEKQYRIERTFGKKDTDDTFKLYDVESGLESEDYTSNVGEELFQVDRDAFEKSVFVPQEALETGMTDSINAKMGNLSAVRDDMNNFDAAIKRVEDAKKVYASRGAVNPGKLVRVRASISECNEALEKLPALNSAFEQKDQLIGDRWAEYHTLAEEKKALQEKIATQSKKEQEIGAYREKKVSIEEARETLESMDEFFSAGIPDGDTFGVAEATEREWAVDRARLGELKERLPEEAEQRRLEELFVGYEIQGDDIDRWNGEARRIQTLQMECQHLQMTEEERNQLQELKIYFRKRIPTPEELTEVLDQASLLTQIDGQMETLEEQYREAQMEHRQLQKKRKAGTGGIVVAILIALVLVAGGFVFHFYTLPSMVTAVVQWVCFIGGALLLLLTGLVSIRSRVLDRKARLEAQQEESNAALALEEKRQQRVEVAGRCQEFLQNFLVTPTESMQQMVLEIQRKADHFQRLSEAEKKYLDQTADSMDELSDLQVSLNSALAHYGLCYDENLEDGGDAKVILERLEKDLKTYNELLDNRSVMQELKQLVSSQEAVVRGFVDKYPTDKNQSYHEQIQTIHLNAEQYQGLVGRLARLEEEVAEFEKAYDVNETVEAVEDLQAKQATIDERLAELRDMNAKGKSEISELAEEIQQLEEVADDLDMYLRLEKEMEERIALFDNTMKYLRQARDQFLSRYMGPLRKGLRRYLNDLEITGLDPESVDLDMDLNVLVQSSGATRKAEYLSSGYQDITALCARFALIDVLYEKEKPMLILDDPFTNFDESKIATSLELLKRLCGDRQVIYFTCHESRMPKDA
ncbi:MAG: AAA family ATPase [Lachnospiraceae bacterium]|nr:AAA family ATPase [Lachnospiraceae bacterium]